MIEKIKAINNPLTIVAIFAGLSEVAGTAALAVVDKTLQQTFIWFVMGFPFALLALFFATLNFNPVVLYAPSDFQNEENFLKNIGRKTRSVSESIGRVTQELGEVKDQLTASLDKVAGEGTKDLKSITENLARVETELTKVRHKADVAAQTVVQNARVFLGSRSSVAELERRNYWEPRIPSRADEKRTRRAIRSILATRPDGSTIEQILGDLKNVDRQTTLNWLSRMRDIGLVVKQEKDGQPLYRLPDPAKPHNA